MLYLGAMENGVDNNVDEVKGSDTKYRKGVNGDAVGFGGKGR